MTYTAPSSLTIGDVVTETIWDTVIEGNWNHLATETTETLFLGVASSAPTYKAPPPVSNMLINGGMTIWQRGTGSNGAFNRTGYWTADGWVITSTGTQLTVDRYTTVPGTYADHHLVSVARLVKTGSDVSYHEQRVYYTDRGAYNYWPDKISLWMKVYVVSGSCRVYAGGNATGVTYSTVSTTGSWQNVKIEGISMGTSDQYIKVGVEVTANGTTVYQGWSCLVPFTKAAPYYPPSLAEEQVACLRHYEVMGGSKNSIWFSTYIDTNNQEFAFPMTFTVRKASPFGTGNNAPTVVRQSTVGHDFTDSSATSWAVGRDGANVCDDKIRVVGPTPSGFSLQGKGNGSVTAGQAHIRAMKEAATIIAYYGDQY